MKAREIVLNAYIAIMAIRGSEEEESEKEEMLSILEDIIGLRREFHNRITTLLSDVPDILVGNYLGSKGYKITYK